MPLLIPVVDRTTNRYIKTVCSLHTLCSELYRFYIIYIILHYASPAASSIMQKHNANTILKDGFA